MAFIVCSCQQIFACLLVHDWDRVNASLAHLDGFQQHMQIWLLKSLITVEGEIGLVLIFPQKVLGLVPINLSGLQIKHLFYSTCNSRRCATRPAVCMLNHPLIHVGTAGNRSKEASPLVPAHSETAWPSCCVCLGRRHLMNSRADHT